MLPEWHLKASLDMSDDVTMNFNHERKMIGPSRPVGCPGLHYAPRSDVEGESENAAQLSLSAGAPDREPIRRKRSLQNQSRST